MRNIRFSPVMLIAVVAIVLVIGIGIWRNNSKSTKTETITTPATQVSQDVAPDQPKLSGKCTTVFSYVKSVNENGLVTLESGESYNPGVTVKVGEYVSYTYCQ